MRHILTPEELDALLADPLEVEPPVEHVRLRVAVPCGSVELTAPVSPGKWYVRRAVREHQPIQGQPQTSELLGGDEERERSDDANAAWKRYVTQLQAEKDPLAGLTASQARYIENLRAIEAANPKASASDIAMALSLVLWEGRIWEKDGKAADVTRPGGLPLVLDYAGGDGYKNVQVSDEQKSALHQQREVHDAHGRESGVAHAFPAVAAQAGREDTLAGAYNTRMVTSGGDFIQDMATMIVDQKFDGVFREAEARDNERAVEIAEAAGSGRPLSELMADEFREENAEQGVFPSA